MCAMVVMMINFSLANWPIFLFPFCNISQLHCSFLVRFAFTPSLFLLLFFPLLRPSCTFIPSHHQLLYFISFSFPSLCLVPLLLPLLTFISSLSLPPSIPLLCLPSFYFPSLLFFSSPSLLSSSPLFRLPPPLI